AISVILALYPAFACDMVNGDRLSMFQARRLRRPGDAYGMMCGGAISNMPLKAATEEPVSRQFRWHRAAAIGFATLFVLSAVWGYWLGHAQPRPVDFLSFWAAGRLALHGKAAMAYNLV